MSWATSRKSPPTTPAIGISASECSRAAMRSSSALSNRRVRSLVGTVAISMTLSVIAITLSASDGGDGSLVAAAAIASRPGVLGQASSHGSPARLDDEVRAAVGGPARLGVLGADRAFLAIADRADAAGRDALRD